MEMDVQDFDPYLLVGLLSIPLLFLKLEGVITGL
jgi:hypothetical protein